MAHPLDGAWAKVARAEEHIKNLNMEIEAFLGQKPAPYLLVGEHRNDGSEYVYVVKKVPVVPVRFAVIAGDVIHNLRSSLDHLAHALVVKGGGTPTNQVQFPICSTVEKFEEARKRGRIKGISASAEKIIRAVQPYKSKTPADSALLVIDDYSVFDKHRLLLVVATVVRMGDRIVIADNPNFVGEKLANVEMLLSNEWVKPKPMSKEGDVVFTLPFKHGGLQVIPDVHLVPHVAFDKAGMTQHRPVIEILTIMLNGVRNTIGSFVGEFA